MGRLIRLDRSGHTTLAEWSGGDGEAPRRRWRPSARELRRAACSRRSATLTGPPRWSASCRSTPSWWCCAGRSPAASGRARWTQRPLEGAPAPPGRRGGPGSSEAAALWWREEASGDRCAATGGAGPRGRPGSWSCSWRPGRRCWSRSAADLPVALVCFAHAWIVPWIQARRGARRWCRSAASAARRGEPADPAAPRGSRWGCSATWSATRERDLLRPHRAGAAAGRARRLAGRRAGSVPGPPAAGGGWIAGACGWPRRRAAGRRSGRASAAGAARGRARFRQGGEPRVLRRDVAGAARAPGVRAAGPCRGAGDGSR